MGKGAETPTKAELGKLKRNVCEAESDCFLFRVPRADCIVENDCAAPARGGRTKVSAGVARGDCTTKIQRISPARSRVTDGSGSRGGAVPRGGVCKTGEAPARGAARSAAGGRRRRPKAGDAFRGGATRPVPFDAKPARENANFPRKLSRGTRPARPAGGGTNAFCFPSMGEPAPPRHRNILNET